MIMSVSDSCSLTINVVELSDELAVFDIGWCT